MEASVASGRHGRRGRCGSDAGHSACRRLGFVLQAFEQVHDEVLLARAGQVVVPGESDGAVPAGFDAGAAQAALGEVQDVLGHGSSSWRPRSLTPSTVMQSLGQARSHSLQAKQIGLPVSRVAHQLDVAAEALGHLQGLVRILHRDRRLEELAEGDPHAREQAVEAGDRFL